MEERKRRAAAFISDRRMGAAAQRLRAQGAEVLEVWNRESFAKLQEMAGELDWLMLPIRGLDAEGCAQLEGESYPLADILEELPRGAAVFTGLWTDWLRALAGRWREQDAGKEIYCYFDDLEIAAENAKLTAEGLLYFFMEKTPESMFSYTVDLIGYGKVGREAAALFEKLGIALRVVKERLDGGEDFWTIDYDRWKTQQPSDVVINTAPVPVITRELAEGWKKEVLVIDVSSGHVGAEADVYGLPGVRIEKAPTLPSLVAWESAGMLLADYLLSGRFCEGRGMEHG